MQELLMNPNTGRYEVAAPSPSTRQQTPGVVDFTRGKIFDIFTLPPEFTFTTASDNGAGALTKTQYIFNQTTLNAGVTNNGSGANSIVNTYGDGFTGKVYDAVVASWGDGRGVRMKGFTVTSTTTTTGAQIATAINTLQMQILNANGQGGSTPVPITVTAALRNSQYQIGVFTIAFEFVLNTLNQISISQPANTTFAFTFVTETGTLLT